MISYGEGVEGKRRFHHRLRARNGRGDLTGVWTLRDMRHPGEWGVGSQGKSVSKQRVPRCHKLLAVR